MGQKKLATPLPPLNSLSRYTPYIGLSLGFLSKEHTIFSKAFTSIRLLSHLILFIARDLVGVQSPTPTIPIVSVCTMSPRDHTPRLDGAMLAATFLETTLIGVFFCLFVSTVDAFLFRARTRQEKLFKPMSVTAVILFLTITGHWVVDIVSAFEAFIRPHNPGYCVEPTGLTPAEKSYLNLANWKQVLNSAFYVTSTVVGDAFMIYRLYIVWGRNKWIIVPPIALCITLIGTGTVVTYLFTQATFPIFKTAGAWITSCFVLTFLCNFYSTSLIAIRIFLSSRQLGRYTDNGLAKIRNILVEAAVLYSACVIISLGTYVGDSNIQFVCVAANGPIIGIIFCMIVTRAHHSLNRSNESHAPHHGVSSPRSRISAGMGMGAVVGASADVVVGMGGVHGLRPMTVRITTQVDSFPDRNQDQDRKSLDEITFSTPPTSPKIYHTHTMEMHSQSFTNTSTRSVTENTTDPEV